MRKEMLILGIASLCGLTACCTDNPPAPPTPPPLTTLSEITNYLDRFYQYRFYQFGSGYHDADFGPGLRIQGFTDGGGKSIAGYDTQSDNMSAATVSPRLAGRLSASEAPEMSDYRAVGSLNYLLANMENCTEKEAPDYAHYRGEAYYFRAWYYYRLLVDYGPVAWIETPFVSEAEAAAVPRTSRTALVDNVLMDLDEAILLLHELQDNTSMRVHRDVARALKSEVALYEATWEKYHKAAADPFCDPTVTDEKIRYYFDQAMEAAQAVIDRGVWKIHNTGSFSKDYRYLFQASDLSANPEVLWFKTYICEPEGNQVNAYLDRGGGGVGVSASLVDDYLTCDGKPFTVERRLEAKRVFGDELLPVVRDPRLALTVCMPGQPLRADDQPPYYVVPPLAGPTVRERCTTGYSLLKHLQIDQAGGKGTTPAIQFRYADILLNYAEALAETDGAGNAQKIIDLLQPLRDRAGMPSVDFDREYNQQEEYPFRNLDKYVQAVRRERRVEQACEGRRLEDLLRWAAAKEAIVGRWPKGVLFVGSNLENHPEYADQLVYDRPSGNNLNLTGAPGDPLRYILPVDATDYPNGWQFDPQRDYLLPVPETMLTAPGGTWVQNPGW